MAWCLKGYTKPFTLMLPVTIEDFANFLTLGLRIFGNIFAGELLMANCCMAFSWNQLFQGCFGTSMARILRIYRFDSGMSL